MATKYGQRRIDTRKKSAINVLKTTSKKAIHKAAEASGDLVGNKIPEKITKAASKNTRADPNRLTAAQIDETSSQQKGIPKERYILPERQK